VLAIARNVLMDHYRRQKLRQWISTDEHPALLSGLRADDWLEPYLAADEVGSWLDQLGDREREVLALRYGSDLQANDIAAVTGLSPANVHQIVSRSLRRLRENAENSVG
jgi:RNA polymerase sigma-70 factor (ECF subfamily)